jgi:predicted MFS family arabinose efflux permease
VGPTLAGFLIDATGAATVFWLNAASFLAVIVAIWSLEERPVPERTGERSVVGDIVAGARYAAGDRPIRVALTAGGVNALLIFPISYVAPVLATQALDLDAAEYGVLVGSFGLGAILAGIQMLLSRDRPYERIVSVGVAGCSIGLLVIGLAPGLLVALVGMFVTGAAFINITTNVLSSLQIQLDDRVRGRVMSLWMMIYGSLGPLGIIVFGAAGDIVDIQTVFIVAAVLMASYLTFMTVRRGFAVLDPPPEALAADTDAR